MRVRGSQRFPWRTVPLGSADPTVAGLTNAALEDPAPAGYQWRFAGDEAGRSIGLRDDGTVEFKHDAATTDHANGTENAPRLIWPLPPLAIADCTRFELQARVTIVSQDVVNNNALGLVLGKADNSVYLASRNRAQTGGTHAHDRSTQGANFATATGKAGVVSTLYVQLFGEVSTSGSYAHSALRDEGVTTTAEGFFNQLVPHDDAYLTLFYKAAGVAGDCVVLPPQYRILDKLA